MDQSSRKNWERSFKFVGFLADIPDLSAVIDSQDVDHNHNILEIYCSQYYTDMNYLDYISSSELIISRCNLNHNKDHYYYYYYYFL